MNVKLPWLYVWINSIKMDNYWVSCIQQLFKWTNNDQKVSTYIYIVILIIILLLIIINCYFENLVPWVIVSFSQTTIF